MFRHSLGVMFWLWSPLQDAMESGHDMSPAVGECAPSFAVEVLSEPATEMQDDSSVAAEAFEPKPHDEPTGKSLEKPTARCAAKQKAKRKVSADTAKSKTPKAPKTKASRSQKTLAKAKCSPKAKAAAKTKASPKAKAKGKAAPKTKAKYATKQKDEVERKMHSAPKLFQEFLLCFCRVCLHSNRYRVLGITYLRYTRARTSKRGMHTWQQRMQLMLLFGPVCSY